MTPIRTSTGAIPNVSAAVERQSDFANGGKRALWQPCLAAIDQDLSGRCEFRPVRRSQRHTHTRRVQAPCLDIPTSSGYRYCCLCNGTVLGVFAYFVKLCGRLTFETGAGSDPAAVCTRPGYLPMRSRAVACGSWSERDLKGILSDRGRLLLTACCFSFLRACRLDCHEPAQAPPQGSG